MKEMDLWIREKKGWDNWKKIHSYLMSYTKIQKSKIKKQNFFV